MGRRNTGSRSMACQMLAVECPCWYGSRPFPVSLGSYCHMPLPLDLEIDETASSHAPPTLAGSDEAGLPSGVGGSRPLLLRLDKKEVPLTGVELSSPCLSPPWSKPTDKLYGWHPGYRHPTVAPKPSGGWFQSLQGYGGSWRFMLWLSSWGIISVAPLGFFLRFRPLGPARGKVHPMGGSTFLILSRTSRSCETAIIINVYSNHMEYNNINYFKTNVPSLLKSCFKYCVQMLNYGASSKRNRGILKSFSNHFVQKGF